MQLFLSQDHRNTDEVPFKPCPVITTAISLKSPNSTSVRHCFKCFLCSNSFPSSQQPHEGNSHFLVPEIRWGSGGDFFYSNIHINASYYILFLMIHGSHEPSKGSENLCSKEAFLSSSQGIQNLFYYSLLLPLTPINVLQKTDQGLLLEISVVAWIQNQAHGQTLMARRCGVEQQGERAITPAILHTTPETLGWGSKTTFHVPIRELSASAELRRGKVWHLTVGQHLIETF